MVSVMASIISKPGTRFFGETRIGYLPRVTHMAVAFSLGHKIIRAASPTSGANPTKATPRSNDFV